MSEPFVPEPGDIVSWMWYGRPIHGTVQEVIPEATSIISKGKHITRNGNPDNPAVIISHKSGNDVIKLASELLQDKDKHP